MYVCAIKKVCFSRRFYFNGTTTRENEEKKSWKFPPSSAMIDDLSVYVKIYYADGNGEQKQES